MFSSWCLVSSGVKGGENDFRNSLRVREQQEMASFEKQLNSGKRSPEKGRFKVEDEWAHCPEAFEKSLRSVFASQCVRVENTENNFQGRTTDFPLV